MSDDQVWCPVCLAFHPHVKQARYEELIAAESRLQQLQLDLDAAKRERDTVALVGGKSLTELHSALGRLGEAEKLLAAASLAMDGRNVPVTLKRIQDFLDGAVEKHRILSENTHDRSDKENKT